MAQDKTTLKVKKKSDTEIIYIYKKEKSKS